MSLQANISDTPFNQKSPRPPEEGVLDFHTQTSGHRDSMTESAQWADSVKSSSPETFQTHGEHSVMFVASKVC